MRETEISAKLCTSLRKDYKAVVFKIHGHAMQQPGIPDFYLAHACWQGWIETKGAETLTTPLQKSILRQLKNAGVDAYILRFMDERRYRFESEDGDILKYFETKNWVDAAGKVLDILHGFRTNKGVLSKTF